MTTRTPAIGSSAIAFGVAMLVASIHLPMAQGAPTADEHATHHEHGTAPGAAPMPGDSLFQLPVHFTTARGAHLMLDHYRGEPVVVTMFYGTCKSACPLLTRAMTATAASLPTAERAKVRFLMVTFDPVRDTEAELARFTREYQLQAPQFEIARTDENGVRLLAAALGIRYRQLPDGNFSHSAILTALDAEGVPRARTENIAGADPEFVAEVRRLVR